MRKTDPFCFIEDDNIALMTMKEAAAAPGAGQVIIIMSSIPLLMVFGMAFGFGCVKRAA